MKKVISLLLVAVLLVSLTGCFFRYGGEHEDLYTVAIYNVFGSCGYRSNGEVSGNPIIEVIETDSYGRVLFFYDEGDHYTLGSGLVVMQKSLSGFVYYYQDICQLPCIRRNYRIDASYSEIFTNEKIAALKENNDWDKPFDAEKCTRSAIVEKKQKGTLGLKEDDFERYIKDYAKANGYKGDDTIFRYCEYLNTDKYGREIYYVYGVGRDVDGEGASPSSKYRHYELAMIFNPDGSCPISNVHEIVDMENIYEEIMGLKVDCGWNEPWPAK